MSASGGSLNVLIQLCLTVKLDDQQPAVSGFNHFIAVQNLFLLELLEEFYSVARTIFTNTALDSGVSMTSTHV